MSGQHPPAAMMAAIVQAQSSAQAVRKDAKNEFHRYAYASTEAIIEESRAALNSAGLALLTAGWDVSPDRLTLRIEYRLVHVSGASLDFVAHAAIVAEKGRPQDKAEATALTQSLGYFLRGLLCLPRVNPEHEVDRRDDRESNGKKPAKPEPAPEAPSAFANESNGKKPAKPEPAPEVPSAFAKSEYEALLDLVGKASEESVADLAKQAMDAYRRGSVSPAQYRGIRDAAAKRVNGLKKGAA